MPPRKNTTKAKAPTAKPRKAKASGLSWEQIARAQVHPTRLAIMERFAADAGVELAPIELAAELDEPLGNVSYHVRAMLNDGLLELSRTEPRRGAVAHFYRASGALVL